MPSEKSSPNKPNYNRIKRVLFPTETLPCNKNETNNINPPRKS